MINQVSTGMNSNVYSSVQKSNEAPYYITKPLTETQKQEGEHEKVKKSNAAWFAVATTAVVVGFGMLFLSKGPSKGLKSTINRWYRNLNDEANKLKKNGDKSWFHGFSLGVLKVSRILINKSKILFNGAPLKDALAMKFIKKSPKMKEYSDSISDYFEKISVKTSKRYYNKTLSSFDGMYAAFNEVASKLSIDDRKMLQEKITNIQKHYNNGFSESARNQRMRLNKADMVGWDDEVYNRTYGDMINFLQSQKKHEPFISEVVAADVKARNFREIENQRIMISNGLKDNYDATRKLFARLDDFIDPTDPVSRNYIKEMGKTLDEYKKVTKAGGDGRQLLVGATIPKNLEALDNYILSTNKYDKDTVNEISKTINSLKNSLNENRRGEVQEIISLLKKNVAAGNLSPSEYEKVKKVAYKATKSLNKSIDMEGDKLFDKVRDLVIGSAPMDVLGLISSLGVVAWGLLHADNNDERVSATLKYGIPAVGGVATTLYCTLGLVSAGPSLIIGLISGALINKLGIEADHIRKKYQGKNVDKNEASIAQISVERLKDKTQQIENKVKKDKSNLK